MKRLELVPHLRALADALPAGTVVPVPREWLLELLGESASLVEPIPARIEQGDRLLTVAEVAGRLEVEEQWVYRHADEWDFTRRLGRRTLRFSEAGLQDYIAKRAA
ncbi:MAG TPA: hypothetical protein PKA66_07400 [Gemmatimonadales bacterium]|nr:hypothetical protein [Gemmatimonadales bacterium]